MSKRIRIYKPQDGGGCFFYTLMNSPSYFLRNEWKQKGGFNFYPVTFGINNRVKKNSDK